MPARLSELPGSGDVVAHLECDLCGVVAAARMEADCEADRVVIRQLMREYPDEVLSVVREIGTFAEDGWRHDYLPDGGTVDVCEACRRG